MDIEVNIGDIGTGKKGDNLLTTGVGSCLVVTLYDPVHRIGALAHTMLPSSTSGEAQRTAKHEIRTANNEQGDTRYIDTAIDWMIRKLLSLGARREALEAKLIGGANMFSAFPSDIGLNNVTKAKEGLEARGINLVGESVGGSQGRSVEFAVDTGIVTVKMKF